MQSAASSPEFVTVLTLSTDRSKYQRTGATAEEAIAFSKRGVPEQCPTDQNPESPNRRVTERVTGSC